MHPDIIQEINTGQVQFRGMLNILTIIIDAYGVLRLDVERLQQLLESLNLFIKSYLILKIENSVRLMTTSVPW